MYHWDEFKHQTKIPVQTVIGLQVNYQVIDAYYEVGIQGSMITEVHVPEGECLHFTTVFIR